MFDNTKVINLRRKTKWKERAVHVVIGSVQLWQKIEGLYPKKTKI
jgi:hypothetical protein